MIPSKAQAVLQNYQFHTALVHNFVEGISHAESVRQLPFEHNCMNWILGHIVTNRSHILETVGIEHAWQADVRGLYHTDTPPIRPESEAIDFAKLVSYLDQSVVLLQPVLQEMSDTQLAESHTNYRGEKSRYDHLTGFHWHEGFHIGQLEILQAFIEAKRD